METDDQKGDEAKRFVTFGMGRDSKGLKTFINSKLDLHCVSCERVILVGEFRYPTWITGSANRCSECYYSGYYSIDIKIKKIAKECPLIPHTRSSRLFSSVRRMKAEKELDIPFSRRNGFVISTETGKRANEMAEEEWEKFYGALSNELKTDYPELYDKLYMKINQSTKLKRIQFVGSPFQGKKLEAIPAPSSTPQPQRNASQMAAELNQKWRDEGTYAEPNPADVGLMQVVFMPKRPPVSSQPNMEINPPTEIKAIQFVGSPFQGKQAEQIRAQAKPNSNTKGSKLSKMMTLVRQIGIWAFWLLVAYFFFLALAECGKLGEAIGFGNACM